MGFYIKPDYFETIHYYFFSLGIFSLTTSFLFTSYNAYTYIFMTFYIINSAISWYMSWFMHTRMKAVFVIRTGTYAATHVLLTVFSGGSAVFMYAYFQLEFESIVTSFIMINFFVVFLGFMWYILGALRISQKFFDWQEKGKLEIGMSMVMKCREKMGVKLVDDKTLRSYKWGTNPEIDQLFMDVKRKSEKGEDFTAIVKRLEMKISEIDILELEAKMTKLGSSEKLEDTDKRMMSSYEALIKSHEKNMLEYEKALYKKENEGK